MILLVHYVGHRSQSIYIPRAPLCLSSRLNWDPSHPFPQVSVLLLNQGGEDTIACGGGPNSDDWREKKHSVYSIAQVHKRTKMTFKNVIFSSKIAMAFALV